MAFSLWQEFGVNPLDLGQPVMYLQSFDDSFITAVTPPLVDGSLINNFKRYNDSGNTFTQVGTTNRANYTIPTGQIHPYGYITWTGDTTSQGQYSFGTTSTFSFMHQTGATFTMYWVFKNVQNEATSTTKILFSTSESTGNRGVLCGLTNTGTLRNPALFIRNDTGGVNVCSMAWDSFESTIDQPVMLYSVRFSDQGTTGVPAGYTYKNGIIDRVANQVALCSPTEASFTTMRVGNRASGTLRFGGYVGELIIFNQMHSEADHLKICNFLKKRWRIN